jgi:hypothetical protein
MPASFHQTSTNTPEAKAFSKTHLLLIAAPRYDQKLIVSATTAEASESKLHQQCVSSTGI